MKQKPWIKGSGEHRNQERPTLVLPSVLSHSKSETCKEKTLDK